jgi:hypothetical protein
MADGRRNEEGDTADDGNAVGEQQRPLVAELSAAAEDDEVLRCTADGCSDAENREDRRNASGRCHAEGDGGDGAGPGVDQQPLPGADPCCVRASVRVTTASISG